ncbi:pathogenicity island 1 effector protein SipA [Salmonella enterica subsp. arizonae]|nr:pathogenicity island 1 effector protein SipA [Salmonella enterica subsp. arizonae]
MLPSVSTQNSVMMTGLQNEIKAQATNLAANISAVNGNAAKTLSGEIKGPQLEDFSSASQTVESGGVVQMWERCRCVKRNLYQLK